MFDERDGAKIAKDRISAWGVLHEETKNPLYIMDAIMQCDDYGILYPAFVLDYIKIAAEKLENIDFDSSYPESEMFKELQFSVPNSTIKKRRKIFEKNLKIVFDIENSIPDDEKDTSFYHFEEKEKGLDIGRLYRIYSAYKRIFSHLTLPQIKAIGLYEEKENIKEGIR